MTEKQTCYGFVTRLPKDDNEMFWRTTGFYGPNPEGSYLYEFSNDMGWKQPVFTKLDMEFFMGKPEQYRFEGLGNREMRPTRPQREDAPVKAAPTAPPIPVPEPVEAKTPVVPEKKRMGRPPKAESTVGA